VQTITNAVASSQNAGSANMSYGYGTGSDLLTSLSAGGTVVQTIGYTADGRISSLNPGIQAPTGQYITSLSYNQDGRYIYDGFEQRLIKTVSGSYGEIYQYGQDGALLEETNASGVAQADYVYLNGRPVAVLNGSTLYLLHDDMLGTPQLATDSSQAVQWQASYDAFGQASVSGTVTQNLRFPGQYFDVESGWNHNGFRDYLPSLGRYAEPDLLGRAGSGNNLYVYVGDSPTNLADPLGLCPPKKNCPATISTDPNTALLSKMIAGEATYSLNSPAEMADIGYSAMNRLAYYTQNPGTNLSLFGATDSTLSGIINSNQYGSVGNPMWNLASNTSSINTATARGEKLCSFFANVFSVAQSVMSNTAPDSLSPMGGTFGFRTTGSGSPGGSYVVAPPSMQIPGSGNTFYGLAP
jgi:RHS repeat-associated protein